MLRTEQLAYRYLGEKYGLDPISLAIQPGEMVLVNGPSGCGKSTLARCLSGLIPHLYRGQLQGKVWIDGLLTSDTPLWQLSEHVGLLFQNPAAQMLASTVEDEILFGLENLGLSRNTIRDRLEETLDQFGLGDFVTRSPLTLSGGEQQKVALAATMARRPPVLVLDEPLSMLDAAASEELVVHLDELAQQGTTIVVCEHRIDPFSNWPDLQTVDLGNGMCPVHDIDAAAFPVDDGEPFTLNVTGVSVRLGQRQVLTDLNF